MAIEKKEKKRDKKTVTKKNDSVGKKAPEKTRKKKESRRVLEATLLPVHDVIIFPYTLSPLIIDKPETIATLDVAMAGDKLVCILPEISPFLKDIADVDVLDATSNTIESFEMHGKQFSRIGTVCRIVKKLRFPDDTVRLLVRGLKRIRVLNVKNNAPHRTVLYEDFNMISDDSVEMIALAQNVMTQFQEIISISPAFPEELKIAILNIDDNVRLVDLITDALNISFMEKLYLLVVPNLKERLQLLSILLNREIEILRVGTDIQRQVSNTLGQAQRSIFLREQLKIIKKELGEDVKNPDILNIEKRIKELDLPKNVLDLLDKEIERLAMIPQAAAEYNVAHTYIDWLLSIPWNIFTEDSIDIVKAKKILDADHYNLIKIKEMILEFLAVLQLKKDRKSPIICFVGPPGVGKTSLGQSIAKAMHRNFVRMSLGGIRDEAEIRGHRRTYIGALPGRIIQGLKKAKSANPVFMLDEIDKIGNDFRGDPASALLEVLDPQQNHSFNDHYIEIDYDLSSVMFIATANITDTIPPALLDRMEIIHLPGYTASEKRNIARRFLVPRQLKENGIKKGQLFFPVATLDDIISMYTREAGVRKLERTIGTICRKVARKIVEKKIDLASRITIGSKDLYDYLGPKKYFQDEIAVKPEIGSAVGMAWTSVGGVILNVEITSMPGKGELQLTGSLGNIMRESAQTAFSLVKSRSRKLKIKSKVFSENDFHIHIPDGATPKDGPSAGITIVIALISHLINMPVRPKTAMTGEITLHGKVTQVGGIKEKVIAALSAGIKDVLLPLKNEKDLQDIPDDVRKHLNFIFISDISKAIDFLMTSYNG